MSNARVLIAWSVALSACSKESPAPPPPGPACEASRYQDPGFCQGRYCRTCSTHADCEELEACQGGRCGGCSSDESCGPGRRCLEAACFPSVLPSWGLTVSELGLGELIRNPYDLARTATCGLTVDGVHYDTGCALSLHGGSSRDFPKKSFRVSFPPMSAHPGYARKINLRAEYNDPTFLRDLLSLEMVRRFSSVPAPRARFVRLSINGAEYGLMAEVERIGDSLLSRYGRSATANLYEADPTLELYRDGGSSLIPLPMPSLYPLAYQFHSGDGTDLAAWIEQQIAVDYATHPAAPTVTTAIRASTDVDGLLDYLAVMALVGNQDHVRKNYYLSPQPVKTVTGTNASGVARWEIYPWDLDLTFGCLYDEQAMSTLCNHFTTDAPERPGVLPDGQPATYPLAGPYNLLIHQVLQDPELDQSFRCRLCAMIDSPMWRTRTQQLIRAYAQTIRDAVASDTMDRNADLSAFDAAISQLESFADARATFLRSRLSCN